MSDDFERFEQEPMTVTLTVDDWATVVAVLLHYRINAQGTPTEHHYAVERIIASISAKVVLGN